MPETCENWLGPENSCIYYAHQTSEIYELLPYSVDFKVPGELWNPLSKTVLSKCSFIWNKGPANIGNNHKVQNDLVRRTCKYLSWFLTFHNSTSWVNYEVSFMSILEENDQGGLMVILSMCQIHIHVLGLSWACPTARFTIHCDSH